MLHLCFDSLASAQKQANIAKPFPLQIHGQKICLIRHAQNQWVAFKDACPHMRVALSKGVVSNNNAIVCPWHKYAFDLSTGLETSGRAVAGLQFLEIVINEQGFFIDIPDNIVHDKDKDEFSY